MYILIHKRNFLLKLLLKLHISNLNFESESRIESSYKEKTNWISPSTKYKVFLPNSPPKFYMVIPSQNYMGMHTPILGFIVLIDYISPPFSYLPD